MKTIVLLHGLYMHSKVMLPMKNRFKKLGYNVENFGYNSIKFSERVLNDLDDLISKIDSDEIYLVGHSMGGLISRQYYSKYKNKKIKSIVTLGTPHNQSVVGKFAEKINLIGSAGYAGITKKIEEWKGEIPLGSIAGTVQLGLLILSQEKSDGTVLLKETQCENQTDHIELNLNHTSLVYSNKSVKQIDFFIKNNKFNKELKSKLKTRNGFRNV